MSRDWCQRGRKTTRLCTSLVTRLGTSLKKPTIRSFIDYDREGNMESFALVAFDTTDRPSRKVYINPFYVSRLETPQSQERQNETYVYLTEENNYQCVKGDIDTVAQRLREA